jgi:signal transduction histidine kinase
MLQRAPHEFALRARLLRQVIIALGLLAAGYLLVSYLGHLRPRFFPYDALITLALCLVCVALYRRGTMVAIGQANSWLVAWINILAAFYSQAYGVRHPITALYLVGIVLSGMLIGGWFLPLWTAMGSLFVVIWAILEWQSPDFPTHPSSTAVPLTSGADVVEVVLLWLPLFAITGWLVRLFARNLELSVQLARGQTAALTETLDALVHQPTAHTPLELALTSIARQLQAEWATLFFYDFAANVASLRLAYGNDAILPAQATKELGPGPVSLDAPVIRQLLETSAPLFIDDVANDSRLQNRALMLAQGIQTVLYIPLMQGERVVGHFAINSLQRRRFQSGDVALAQALAQQATLAMQLADLSERAQETAVLAERNRLAREIHDTLAQGFTGIVIQLEAAEDSLTDDLDEAREHLSRARLLARENLAEARRSIQALRPLAMESDDLPGALRQTADRLTDGLNLAATVRVLGEARPLQTEVENELLRIAQESLRNVVKHAGATAVTLELQYAPEQITLTIADDGQGFDPQAPTGGFGLMGLRERAARLDATLTIESQPGAGTKVICRLEEK